MAETTMAKMVCGRNILWPNRSVDETSLKHEDSFFCNIRDILILYDLPSITDLQANLQSKISWKKLVRKEV